ncbi:monovalent cation/H+ antiporter complex subunit F [Desulfoferrobacter suflitae]|uniref:monovalent cation/H+ antiporter complex subunit F n=1 Tax=Desulfoferrobacter suflitae TaxID=2865782 RepID=UPI0021647A6F|nr:monovalent cation/H+ antiporter complex subunit F [Desulfoferrobacter suflitae]MCK8600339.1 monovalent cation/H+ antiporter complex subunit F [Desulfoferrobacter suflitae]
MNDFYLAVSAFLLVNILVGLVRILRGPTPPDRMLMAQMFGTTGVGILLLLSEAMGLPVLRDVALLFALLGALATVSFVRRYWPVEFAEEESKE